MKKKTELLADAIETNFTLHWSMYPFRVKAFYKWYAPGHPDGEIIRRPSDDDIELVESVLPSKSLRNIKECEVFLQQKCNLQNLDSQTFDHVVIAVKNYIQEQEKHESEDVPESHGFEFSNGQVFYDGTDLELPPGRVVEIFEKLFKNSPKTVLHEDLESDSVNAATDQLRGEIGKIRKALKPKKIPYKVKTITTFGYALVSK